MKKKVLPILVSVLLACSLLALAGCKDDNAAPPTESKDGSTVILNVSGTPADYSANQVLYAVAGKLQNYSTYRIDKAGETVAKKGFITYKQVTENRLVKNGDEAFAQAISDSTLVKMKHQAFVKNGKAVYRDSLDGELSVTTSDDYKDNYGIVPGSANFTNYILNDKTIVYSEKVESKSTDSQYTYRYVLNRESATSLLKRQMKRFGGLTGYPEYTADIELLLTVKSDWTPVSFECSENYDISKQIIGKLSCTQKLSATFSNLNQKVEIPDSAAFNAKIGSTPTEIDPGTSEEGNPVFEGLIDAFVNTDLANGVVLTGSLDGNLNGASISLPLEVGIKFDLDDYSEFGMSSALFISAETNLLGKTANFYYNGDNKLYINLGGAKFAYEVPSVEPGADGVESLSRFVKLTETNDGFRITVDPILMVGLKAALEKNGIVLNDLYLDVSTSQERACGLHFALNGEGFGAELNAVLADKKLVMPTDLDTYQAQGVAFDISIRTDALFSGTELPIEVSVSLDLEALFSGNAAAALQAKISLKLTEVTNPSYYQAGYLLKLIIFALPGMQPDLVIPPFLQAVGGEATEVNVYYTGDGKLYLTADKTTTIDSAGETVPCDPVTLAVLTVDLSETMNDLISSGILDGLGGNFDPTSLIDGLSAKLNVQKDGFNVELSFPESIVQALREGWKGIATDLIASAGDMGAILGSLNGDIDAVKIIASFDRDGTFKEFEFLISMISPTTGSSVALLSIRVGGFELIGEIDHSGEMDDTTEDWAIAEAIVNRIIALEAEMNLGDAEFMAKAAAIKTDYEALTEAQQALVYNYSQIDRILETFQSKKAEADEFIRLFGTLSNATDEDWETIDSLVKEFDVLQITYIDSLDVEMLKNYRIAREAYEGDLAAKYVVTIAGLSEKYAAADTIDELKKFFDECISVRFNYETKLQDEAKAAVTNWATFENIEKDCFERCNEFLIGSFTSQTTKMNALNGETLCDLSDFRDQIRSLNVFFNATYKKNSAMTEMFPDTKKAYDDWTSLWKKDVTKGFQKAAIETLIASIDGLTALQENCKTLEDWQVNFAWIQKIDACYKEAEYFLNFSNRSKVTNYSKLAEFKQLAAAKIEELTPAPEQPAA